MVSSLFGISISIIYNYSYYTVLLLPAVLLLIVAHLKLTELLCNIALSSTTAVTPSSEVEKKAKEEQQVCLCTCVCVCVCVCRLLV